MINMVGSKEEKGADKRKYHVEILIMCLNLKERMHIVTPVN